MIEGSSVLLVDDNPEVVEILSDFLSLNGCNVYKASTGAKALEELEKNNVEIVILDVKLPDINGINLLDTIKVKNPTISVIMITGFYDPNYVVEAMKKGATDFLMKPFEFDKLMLVLIRALRERELLVEKENIFQSLEDKKKIEVLNRELQKKIKELTTMYRITNQFNSLNVFDDVYDKTVHIIHDILDVKSCGYYIFDNRNLELILYKDKSAGDENRIEPKIVMPGNIIEKFNSQRKYFVDNDKFYFPILIKGECIGFIVIGSKKEANGRNKNLLDSDIFFLKLIAEKASTQIENKMLYESLFENVFQTLTSLIEAINKRDSYTENHCKRVTNMCLNLADAIRLADYEKDVLRVVGPVHDLGKLGIPDSILLKPGKLTDEEYYTMKCHSIYGEEIVNRFEILANEAKIIRGHHERFDGRGYPDSLSGEGIPFCSRVIAVCDTYDAMVTGRPYRKGLSQDEALEEIKRCRGSQFDPDVADSFISMVSK